MFPAMGATTGTERQLLVGEQAIAEYCGKCTVTIWRWRRADPTFPVRRHACSNQLIAFTDELDAWFRRAPIASRTTRKRRR